jgi:hypothetical protein
MSSPTWANLRQDAVLIVLVGRHHMDEALRAGDGAR